MSQATVLLPPYWQSKLSASTNLARVMQRFFIILALRCVEQTRENLGHMKTTTLPLKHSINLSPVQLALLLIPLALVYFALSPQARAVCQEGCVTTFNTVLGDDALLNETGFNNTAIGAVALQSNTTGGGNTAIGTSSLQRNTTGLNNTANGGSALGFNTTGTNNTASGWGALFSNQTGIGNVALGVEAAESNNDGNFNTASGYQALLSNSGGSFNTANGYHALLGNATGSRNIGLGFEAGKNLITGSNNIDIGNIGVAGDSGIVRIGSDGTHTATFIAGIVTSPLGTAVGVGITPAGQLGVRVSSARYKEAIKPMDNVSEAILALKPVTFRYKHELDPEDIPQFGLVAEEVEKVNPDLVARDEQGKPYTVRYEAVNAMLLNEFIKEHRKNEKQEATIGDLKAEIATLSAAVKEQAAQIQKVSAQLAAASPSSGGLEMSKTAPQIVRNDRQSR
jgi:hypothetical protein